MGKTTESTEQQVDIETPTSMVEDTLPGGKVADNPRMPRIGQLVTGRYEITGMAGEGGFAAVYRAVDHKAGGEVALKVLDHWKSGRTRFKARFRQEVLVTRKLKHHNTIKVWDVGETEDGCLFMAMEFVAGEPLNELIRRDAPLTPQRTFRIARQILASLAEAHSAGIIHRDLKPNNIMVAQLKGEPDYVKVLDFGIAKALSPELSQLKTSENEMMCTPNYAAPELLRGGLVLPATDIYAAGLIIFEMLAGKPLIQDENIWDIVAAQVSEEPFDLGSEISETPLGEIIAKAINKSSADRFRNGEQMLHDLDAAAAEMTLSTGPVSLTAMPVARPAVGHALIDSATASGGRGVGRSRLKLALLAMLLLAVGGGGVYAFVLFGPGSSTQTEGSGSLSSAGAEPDGDSHTDHNEPTEGDVGHSLASHTHSLPASEHIAAEVRALEEECADGDAEACLAVADHIDRGIEGVERSVALSFYLAACESHLLRGCVAAGRYQLADDPATAVRWFRRACNLGYGEGCGELGYVYLSGRSIGRDDSLALSMFERACNAGHLDSCRGAAVLYARGQGAPSDGLRAAELLDSSCEQGHLLSCVTQGVFAELGLGGEADPESAHLLYEGACDSGEPAGCASLGSMLERGVETAADVPHAAEFYQQSCDQGYGAACLRLAGLLRDGEGLEVDAERSRILFEAACSMGVLHACGQL